jgi:hypothetical protein
MLMLGAVDGKKFTPCRGLAYALEKNLRNAI